MRHCPDTAALRSTLRQALHEASHGGESVLAVLAATAPLNRAAASILAAVPQVGVLVCLDACDDASLAGVLQLGVDAWCPRNCAPAVMALALHSLKRRLEACAPSVHPSASPVIQHRGAGAKLPVWMLLDHGWVLKTPAGKALRLTSSERAFMLGLAQSEAHTATHAQLLHALGRGEPDTSAARARLGVLVSRLRRKAAAQGEQLPLQSLHSRGYMFIDPITLEADVSKGRQINTEQPANQECGFAERRLNTMLSR